MMNGRPFSLLATTDSEQFRWKMPVSVSSTSKSVLAGENLAKHRGAEGLGWFDNKDGDDIMRSIMEYRAWDYWQDFKLWYPFFTRPPSWLDTEIDESALNGKHLYHDGRAVSFRGTEVFDFGQKRWDKYTYLLGTMLTDEERYSDEYHVRATWKAHPSLVFDNVWGLPSNLEFHTDDGDIRYSAVYHESLVQRIKYRRVGYLQNCVFRDDGNGNKVFSVEGPKSWFAPMKIGGTRADATDLAGRPFSMNGDIPSYGKYPRDMADRKRTQTVLNWMAWDPDSPVFCRNDNGPYHKWISKHIYKWYQSPHVKPILGGKRLDFNLDETIRNEGAKSNWFYGPNMTDWPFLEDTQYQKYMIYKAKYEPGVYTVVEGMTDSQGLRGFTDRNCETAMNNYTPYIIYWKNVDYDDSEIMARLCGDGLYFKKKDNGVSHLLSTYDVLIKGSGHAQHPTEESLEEKSEAEQHGFGADCAFDLLLCVTAYENTVFTANRSAIAVSYRDYGTIDPETDIETFRGCGASISRIWQDELTDEHRRHDDRKLSCMGWVKQTTPSAVNIEVVPCVRLFSRLPPKPRQQAQQGGGEGGGGTT